MTRLLSIFVPVLIAFSVQAGQIQRAESPIADQYIVVLNSDLPALASRATNSERRSGVDAVSRDLARDFRGQISGVFADTLRGFAVRMNQRDAAALARDPRVAYVAEDQWVQGTSSSTQFDPPSWGLDRIDQRDVLLDAQYRYVDDSAQSSVHVYVVDSGIHYTHEDFGGRVDAINGFNPYTDGFGVEGCHGHGTHVAGTIGGSSFGVAKNVTLHPVRVLNCWNGGPVSAVIMGVDWVTARMNDEPHAAIANLSLITAPSQTLDDAIRASIAAGVTYVVAAGNNSADACNYSPARVAEAITVGASTPSDSMASNSNFGACVDLYAPGTGIVSAFNGSNTDSLTMSGTSMSAAHVSGVAATLLAQAPNRSPPELTDLIIANATELPTDIDPTGNHLLAYSFVELETEPEVDPLILDFRVSCTAWPRRCAFEGLIKNNPLPVDIWLWDFGDGNLIKHQSPTARHAYADNLVEVDVVLTVLLENGELVSKASVLKLPSFNGQR